MKGLLGKMMWMETLNNPQDNNINMFDVLSISGDMPEAVQQQQAMLMTEAAEEAGIAA